MTFFAQMCFLDSRDIAPRSLPNDVMLVFMTDPAGFWGDEASMQREPEYDPSRRFQVSKHEIMFGDVGCLYFLIDGKGRVRCQMDSY